MDFTQYTSQELFTIGKLTVDLGQLLKIIGAVGGFSLIGYLLLNWLLPRFYNREHISSELHPRAKRVILSGVIVFSIIAILRVLDLDFLLLQYEHEFEDDTRLLQIRISTIMKAALILVFAGLVDWFIEEFLVQWYHRNRVKGATSEEDMAKRVSGSVRPVVYTLAIMVIAGDIGATNLALFKLGMGTDHETVVFVQNFLSAALVLFIVRLAVLMATRFALAGYYRRAKVDQGSQYALDRLLTYFAYLIGILLVLQTAGFSLIGIWTGAAALLVGIGIGLQQTFNDLICGIIILFERSVKVGDVLDMGGPDQVGTVRKIGARTSQVTTRDNILLYVPNSKLIGESVVNWSQASNRTRFHVPVGVAYGSDTSLVKKLLLEAAETHGHVLRNPKPVVRLLDFGDSSLNFDLLFFVKRNDLERVEDIRSDLRFLIDSAFRNYGVEIPFPQRDIWLKNPVKIAESRLEVREEE